MPLFSNVIDKVISAVPAPQKAAIAAGSIALYFAGDTYVRVKRDERLSPGSGINKLLSFFSNPTATPVSDEVTVSDGVTV